MTSRAAKFLSVMQLVIDQSKRLGDTSRESLSESLLNFSRVFNFRYVQFKRLRRKLPKIVGCQLLSEVSVAVLAVIDELSKRALPCNDSQFGVVELCKIEQIRSGVVSVIVELCRLEDYGSLSDDEVIIIYLRRLSWMGAKKKLWLMSKLIVEAFPDLEEVAAKSNYTADLQRYFLPADALPLKQASGKELLDKSLPKEFLDKLNAIKDVQLLLETSPDESLCSMCIFSDLSYGNFAIVDSCNHLYCLDCIQTHFKTQDDAFCFVDGCKRRMRWYMKKQTLVESRIPFRDN